MAPPRNTLAGYHVASHCAGAMWRRTNAEGCYAGPCGRCEVGVTVSQHPTHRGPRVLTGTEEEQHGEGADAG